MGKEINPFIGLIAAPPGRLTQSPSFVRVVDGRKLDSINTRHRNQPLTAASDAQDIKEERDRIRREKAKAYFRARYQRLKNDPEFQSKRRAYDEATAERRRAYQREWDAANRERLRERQREWQRRTYATSEDRRQRRKEATRRYYQANRERILAKARERRAAFMAEADQA